ncbi:MAG: hypothetical protein Q8L34_01315, partial [Candidatus Woesearchaeota archaeon]|nr:hypothetical protein [Candidatus Woesearchaeota archaeon]
MRKRKESNTADQESQERERKEKETATSRCCSMKPVSYKENKHIDHKRVEETTPVNTKLLLFLAAAAFLIMIFNQFQLLSIASLAEGRPLATGISLVAASVAPTGVPAIYGSELGISYDDVSANDPQKADQTIRVLKSYDESLTLQGKDLDRYIGITSQISCEYCCGAKSIIFTKEDEQRIEQQIQDAIANGKITADQADQYRQKAGGAACGCAHSFAMRGLAKYLITEHASEYTDAQILEELAKWKTLFFPGPMSTKAAAMKEKGIPFTYSNLGSNAYRGIEKDVT